MKLSGSDWAIDEVLVAENFVERYRGIRGVGANGCFGITARSVHTVGLGQPIEAFAIDKRGTVVDVRTLRPNRFFRFPDAELIVEMSQGSATPPLGSVLEVSHA